MPEPRQPQDHKAKTVKDLEELEEYFSFTAPDGSIYVMPNKTTEVIGAGFIRENRRRDETDFVFTAIEALAGNGKEGREILAAIDGMTQREAVKLVFEPFQKHSNLNLGE